MRQLAAFIATVAVVGACAARTVPQLSAICEGRHVRQQLMLHVDSVTPQAGPALQQVAGRSADLTVTMMSEAGDAPCANRSGSGTWLGELPAALETATDPDRRVAWRVEGESVMLNLNPLTLDNNLNLVLPLNGDEGSWSLATLAGVVASGRVMPMNHAR